MCTLIRRFLNFIEKIKQMKKVALKNMFEVIRKDADN